MIKKIIKKSGNQENSMAFFFFRRMLLGKMGSSGKKLKEAYAAQLVNGLPDRHPRTVEHLHQKFKRSGRKNQVFRDTPPIHRALSPAPAVRPLGFAAQSLSAPRWIGRSVPSPREERRRGSLLFPQPNQYLRANP